MKGDENREESELETVESAEKQKQEEAKRPTLCIDFRHSDDYRKRERGEKSCREKKERKKERKEGRKREALGLEAGRLHLFISSSTAQMPVLSINSPQPLAFHPRV